MGRQEKHTRRPLMTATLTLPGLAAVFCCMTTPPAGATTRPAQHPAAATWADPGTVHAARLASAARPTVLPATYTVRAGDTLTSIAQRLYSDPAAWPALYWANQRNIRWADDIDTGQVLQVPAEPVRIPAAPAQLAPPVVQVQVQVSAVPVHPSAPAQAPVQYPAPPAQAAPVQAAAVYSGSGTFQACVIRRESGGDPHAVNPSGAGGLYQFMPATFAGLGYSGRPQDAPVWEQNQAFQRLYAQAGRAPWVSDGC